MNTMNERFMKLRKACGKNQSEFAKILGLSRSGVTAIETGQRNVTEKHLIMLSNWKEHNINIDWLRTGKGDMFLKTPDTLLEQLQQKYSMSDFELNIIRNYLSLSQKKREFFQDFMYNIVASEQAAASVTEIPTRFVQYFQKLASAGTGEVIFDDLTTDRIEIPDIPEYRRVAYAIGVNGHSMEPLYSDGDMLLVEPTCQIEIGEIGIFNIDGKAYVKKLGNGELISLNKEYDNIPITNESLCMGRVVGKV